MIAFIRERMPRATKAPQESEPEQSWSLEAEPSINRPSAQEFDRVRAATIDEWREDLPENTLGRLFTADEVARVNAHRGPCRASIGGVCLDDVRRYPVR